ncbi:phosphonate metabolism transcriptional regulator PhnF [Thalassovita aquimarina]|uniref:Phosphonate metabolism transcriptional regulator PhnF n=1 Tax=Thalassovita aquimarina TaxID=2785917 RepID=A0ABS5HP11_9RHOB|nr:phosphonate metabolism transcriptional regulator PhnF [Thalassovita aquimarina]MBR9650697.1 phosphonate metabolism transcriptional regulator PhnF [Thalassovita aquimarina]
MSRDKWKSIRDAIEDDIASGQLQPGERLPTEPQLAERHQAGRHSVRKAIAELAKTGKLRVEQGRGTFVETAPTIAYAIGRRTRLHAQGIDVSGELLGAERIAASGRVQHALWLEPGAPVIESRRLTRANKVPIAFGRAYRSAERFPDFVERMDLLGSATETWKSYGIADYLRGETSIHGRLARPEEARLLKQHPDLPVMVIRAVDTMMDGTPLSFSEVIWSATRVKFTFETDGVQ